MAPSSLNGTVCERLGHLAEERGDSLAFRFLVDGESQTDEITFRELFTEASAVAATLAAQTAPGDRVLLLQASGIEALISLYGCWLASTIAVPVPAPHPGRIRASLDRLVSVVADAQPKVVLTDAERFAARDQFAQRSWELAVPSWH